MSLEIFFGISATVLGLILGSAVTALAWRVPRGESWVHGRSRCPGCGHELGVADLVPVLSWGVSRGRCRHCAARVSLRYPLTEVVCAAWALLAWQKLGFTPLFGLLLVWGCLLVALFWIDLDFQLLPDALTFPGTLVALGVALIGPGWRHALFGLLAGPGLLWLVAEIYFRVRKIEGLGGGDIKLAAMFGAVLGGPLTLMTILLAAFFGSLWALVLVLQRKADGLTALPFGTLLAPAAMVVYLWGGPLLEAYLRLLH